MEKGITVVNFQLESRDVSMLRGGRFQGRKCAGVALNSSHSCQILNAGLSTLLVSTTGLFSVWLLIKCLCHELFHLYVPQWDLFLSVMKIAGTKRFLCVWALLPRCMDLELFLSYVNRLIAHIYCIAWFTCTALLGFPYLIFLCCIQYCFQTIYSVLLCDLKL